MKRHILAAHDGKRYKCMGCELTFTDKQYVVKQHIKTAHEDTKFNCHKCDKVYSQSGNLRIHLEWHDLKENGLMIKCKECQKKFSNRENFNSHIYRFHRGIRIEPEIVDEEISDGN